MKNLIFRSKKITDLQVAKEGNLYPEIFIYSGSSMKGLFSVGDLISIKKVRLKDLAKGDVIVFNKCDENQKDCPVVHRIQSIIKNTIITKGDNNRYFDFPHTIMTNYAWKVENFERNGKTYKVIGGLQGLYLSKIKFLIRKSIYLFYKNSTRFSLIRSSIKFLLKRFLKDIQKIELYTKNGKIIKWVLDGKSIAQKGPKKDYFYIKKPFDLIIEKQKKEVRSQEIEESRKNSH